MTDKRPNANGFQYIQPRRKIPKLDVSIVSSGTGGFAASTSTAAGSSRPQFVQPMLRAAPTYTSRSHATTNNAFQQRGGGGGVIPASNSSGRGGGGGAMRPPAATNSEDMWGDEDEDFIMLASQVVEKVENFGQSILVDSMDVSFGDFQRNRQATDNSTQKPNGGGGVTVAVPRAAAAAAIASAANDEDALLREFRHPMGVNADDDDDDDDVFSELPDFDQIDDVNKHINEYLNNDQNTLAQNYSDGSATSGEQAAAAVKRTLSNGSNNTLLARPSNNGPMSGAAASSVHNNYMQNVENAREVRLKFLSAQLAEKQRDNEQLQLEVTKLNERCQTKDGEIAMIRYDLQLNKKVQTDLRQDKLNESERIKGEYASKLADLERTNQGHQSEMEFMRLEILNLKSRRAPDTSHTLHRTHTSHDHNKPVVLDAALVSMFRLHLTALPVTAQPSAAPRHLFRPQKQLQQLASPYGKHRPPNSLADQLDTLQRLAASLDAASATTTSLPLIMSVTAKCIRIMVHDCDSLAACRVNDGRPDHILYHCDDERTQATRSRLLAADSMAADVDLFEDESLRVGRRIVACLATIARSNVRFCELMCAATRKDEAAATAAAAAAASVPPLDGHVHTLAKLLTTIGLSTKWRQYLGLVEAAAELLRALGTQYSGAAARRRRVHWDAALQQLLHAVLFCRPVGRALGHVAHFLRTISTVVQPASEFLQTVCQHSGEFALVSDAPRRVQFGVRSCTLQLFAVLAQTEFVPFAAGGHDRRLLADMTLDTLRLMQNAVDRPLGWLVRPERAADEEEYEDLCLCYAQLVCACVVLMHLCVKQWLLQPRMFDLKTIITIAQAGVIFISDHFTMRYEGLILRVGGPAIKQRLHVTFAWFQQYQKVFLFERVHEQALLSTNNLRGVRHMFELLSNTAGADSEPPPGGDTRAAAQIWSGALGTVRALRESPERDANDSDGDEEPAY